MIPIQVIKELERREEGIAFGSVTLKIVKHDGHKTRYLWNEETSWVEGSPTSGEGGHCNIRNYGTNSHVLGIKHEK